MIPRCTEVKLVDLSAKKLIFKAGDVTYQYLYHKASGSFDDNIKKYFSNSCDKSVVNKLNAIDKKRLKLGKVFKGMSKQGVILAIGYPPLRTTPSLDVNTWKYWSNRFNTFDVRFNEKGLITEIID